MKEKIKEICKKVYDEIDYRIYSIKHKYYSLRSWFRYCLNKQHFNLIWTAVSNRPYDFSSMLNVEYAQLLDMLHYFENGEFIVQEEYDKICMQIRRAITMLEIVIDKRETYHYTGDFEFEEYHDERYPDKTLYTLKTDKHIYHCDVNVNLRNIDRFVKNDDYKKYVLKHPHELYELKAHHLYYKAKEYYSQNWSD